MVLLASLVLVASPHAAELKVATFNTESDSDTQPFKVAETIRAVGEIDIWALQEVASKQAGSEFTVAACSVGGRRLHRKPWRVTSCDIHISSSGIAKALDQVGVLHSR